MTYRNPTDPPRTSTDPGLFGWAIGALVVAVTIVAIIALVNALNRGPVSRTGTAPSTTPSSTAQGGAANTGAATITERSRRPLSIGVSIARGGRWTARSSRTSDKA
jgi:hypothetical protein